MITNSIILVAVLLAGLCIFSKVNYEGMKDEMLYGYLFAAVVIFVAFTIGQSVMSPSPIKPPDPYDWKYECIQKGGAIVKDYIQAPGDHDAHYYDTCKQAVPSPFIISTPVHN